MLTLTRGFGQNICHVLFLWEVFFILFPMDLNFILTLLHPDLRFSSLTCLFLIHQHMIQLFGNLFCWISFSFSASHNKQHWHISFIQSLHLVFAEFKFLWIHCYCLFPFLISSYPSLNYYYYYCYLNLYHFIPLSCGRYSMTYSLEAQN